MHDLNEIRRRLIRLTALLPPCHSAGEGQRDLTDTIVNYQGPLSVEKARAEFCRSRGVTTYTLSEMPRWESITFPKRAAKEAGLFGVFIRSSDLLRWSAEGGGRNASYYVALADALDAAPTARPVVEDPSRRHLQLLEACLELMDICEDDKHYIPVNGQLELIRVTADALRKVEQGHEEIYLGVDYPSDMLPQPNEPGITSSALVGLAGSALNCAMERAQYISASEKVQIEMALSYYPDAEVEVEVNVPGGGGYTFCDLQLLDGPVPHHIMLPADGAVHLDHYGDRSRFSPAVGEFEFTVHRRAADIDVEEEYPGLCFLVSDRLTYTADYNPA
ncbi:hypothetical protein [Devosia sp. A369]